MIIMLRPCFILIRTRNPPGLQGTHYRFSLVYFMRPANSVVLRALADSSPLIADAVARAPDPTMYETGATAIEWFTRRVKMIRIANYKVRHACRSLKTESGS